MNVQQRPITGIEPYEKNAKVHPKDQITKIANSIQAFGFNQPIVVDKEGVIIVGHGRYFAALQLGLEMVPVLEVELSSEKAAAYRLADNKLNESDWNMELVIGELKGLSPDMLDLTGFDSDLLIDDDDKDDVVPGTPKEPRSKPGDAYLLGNHIVVCGDSTLPETYEAFGAAKADMVFTDPPYNVNYESAVQGGIMNDNMEEGAFETFLTHAFDAMGTIVKGGAGWYVFHSPKTQHSFQKALALSNLEIVEQLIWNKPSAGLGQNDYRSKHEPFFYVVRKGEKPEFYGDRTHTSVIDFQATEAQLVAWAKKQKRLEAEGKTTIWTMKREHTASYLHPTQKPVELITYALKNSSKVGDVVLDAFGGSGATLIACEKAERSARLVELDPKFCDVIVQRYVDFTGRTEVEKNGLPELWEISKKEPDPFDEEDDHGTDEE